MTAPMRVNTYEIDAAGERLNAENITLIDCFPGPENGDEYLLAYTELERTGRYWGGGGASPLFLIMRVRT